MPHQILTNIRKMNAAIDEDGVVAYSMINGDIAVNMNAFVGTKFSIKFHGQINCIHCQAETPKSYMGYCKTCSETLARADQCSLSPEKCHYENGTCREPLWGEENCFGKHIVYISNTGQRKVGITRFSTDDVSSRWIDQGSSTAAAFITTANRKLSGLVEIICKKHISDRTHWTKMLAAVEPDADMEEFIKEFKLLIKDDIEALQAEHGLLAVQWVDEPIVHHIKYPILSLPSKVKSINLDKDPLFRGELTGIKGQYLIFKCGAVINLRKYAGYRITFGHDE
jgi:hypothetical protein